MNIDLAAYQATTAKIDASPAQRAQVRQAAEDFESVFLSEMLKPMFAEVGQGEGLFGGGSGEGIYRSLMVQEYGKAISAGGGVGIADAVEREMLRMQAEATK